MRIQVAGAGDFTFGSRKVRPPFKATCRDLKWTSWCGCSQTHNNSLKMSRSRLCSCRFAGNGFHARFGQSSADMESEPNNQGPKDAKQPHTSQKNALRHQRSRKEATAILLRSDLANASLVHEQEQLEQVGAHLDGCSQELGSG